MISMNTLMYKAFLMKAQNLHEESLDLFIKTKEMLEQSKHKAELGEIDKDLNAQIDELKTTI